MIYVHTIDLGIQDFKKLNHSFCNCLQLERDSRIYASWFRIIEFQGMCV